MGTGKDYKFDEVTILSALAMGMPGKRTFFLTIGRKENWVRVWIEKYLLEPLAMAIDQFLLTLSQEQPNLDGKADETSLSNDVPSGLPSAELEIEQITLGFDQERAALNIVVHPSGPQRSLQADLYCRATLSQLRNLSNQAKSICAAGRPICLLCGNPIDPTGHICPTGN